MKKKTKTQNKELTEQRGRLKEKKMSNKNVTL
jgi:hypothetical protein